MKLSRYARYYALFIAAISLLQMILGANILVLLAIDAVCLAAVVPLSRRAFDPCDLLYLALCLYYGTFSLILKTLVLQPVQMNLQAPLTTSAYLLAGFGMLTATYVLVGRITAAYYPGTRLRKWTEFERTYATPEFLARYTLPFSLLAIGFVTVLALTSHSAQEVATGLAKSGGLGTLASLTPVIQLALAMQLSLLARRGHMTERLLVGLTLGVGFALSVLNDQKALAFQLIITVVLHLVAYRIRISPRTLLGGLLLGAVAFLYVAPVIHIIRAMQIEKTERVGEAISILEEAQFNPLVLVEMQSKAETGSGRLSLAAEADYLAPNELNTDRFTLLMPIDQMVRYENREPFGLGAYVNEFVTMTLPKFIVGEHTDAILSDQMAWRFSIRENNVISRPVLGFLGTGYGVDGFWGLMLIGPFCVLILMMTSKWVCTGSIWENPWAVYIAAMLFFDGEADMTVISSIIRGFVPLMILSWSMVKLYHLFDKKRKPKATVQAPVAG